MIPLNATQDSTLRRSLPEVCVTLMQFKLCLTLLNHVLQQNWKVVCTDKLAIDWLTSYSIRKQRHRIVGRYVFNFHLI